MTYSPAFWVVGLFLYVVAGRLTMRRLGGTPREAATALLNLAGVFVFLFYSYANGGHFANAAKFAGYILLVIFQYLLLRAFAEAKGWRPWLAFFAPLAALVVVRYAYGQISTLAEHVLGKNLHGLPSLIGISYLAFRCSRLVLEVRNGSVKKPGLWQYLGFAFFLPTMSLGPINTYANFQRGFAAAPWEVPAGRAALRILTGLIKYQFLSAVFSQLTYSAFLLNGHPHYWIDLPIIMLFYYFYLYCNFSGFCDMAIGVASLIGIPVLENFDNPMAARNMKDFWNRWHITLSQWMRDIVFVPLSKSLVRLLGPPNANHAIALAITIVFLLVGVWHGVGWNYAAFGAFHALGVVVNHYYTIGLKKWLGREGFKAYNENRWIHATAVVLTFAYCAASFMLFANTFPEIREIFQCLR